MLNSNICLKVGCKIVCLGMKAKLYPSFIQTAVRWLQLSISKLPSIILAAGYPCKLALASYDIEARANL